MKAIKFLIIACLLFFPKGYATNGDNDPKPWNYLTFYYVDNSEGSSANQMNDEMIDHLKDQLKKLGSRGDNYFYFYGCNGTEQLISENLASFPDGTGLKKYLKNPSKESDYYYDKKTIREHFTEYPIKVRQSVEMNIYLSAYAARRATKEMETLPTPLFLPNELPMFLNANNLKELNIKTFIYINKELKDELGEDKINKYFNFCRERLHLEKNVMTITYL